MLSEPLPCVLFRPCCAARSFTLEHIPTLHGVCWQAGRMSRKRWRKHALHTCQFHIQNKYRCLLLLTIRSRLPCLLPLPFLPRNELLLRMPLQDVKFKGVCPFRVLSFHIAVCSNCVSFPRVFRSTWLFYSVPHVLCFKCSFFIPHACRFYRHIC